MNSETIWKRKQKISLMGILVAGLSLTACGGGGGSDSSSTETDAVPVDRMLVTNNDPKYNAINEEAKLSIQSQTEHGICAAFYMGTYSQRAMFEKEFDIENYYHPVEDFSIEWDYGEDYVKEHFSFLLQNLNDPLTDSEQDIVDTRCEVLGKQLADNPVVKLSIDFADGSGIGDRVDVVADNDDQYSSSENIGQIMLVHKDGMARPLTPFDGVYAPYSRQPRFSMSGVTVYNWSGYIGQMQEYTYYLTQRESSSDYVLYEGEPVKGTLIVNYISGE